MINTYFAHSAGGRSALPRGKYVPALFSGQDTSSTCFPDAIIDSFVQAGKIVTSEAFFAARSKNIFEPSQTTEMQIPVDDAKRLIINALTEFDLDLGRRAGEILNDPERLNLYEIEAGKRGMMRVRAAGLVMAADDDMRLENAGLPQDFLDDLRTRYPDDENIGSDRAVIDFDYDGTTGSVVYLAHELGHALADDSQLAAGYSYHSNPEHMKETQAYVVQNIVLDNLRENSELDVNKTAHHIYTKDMLQNFCDLSLSMVSKDALDAVNAGQDINPAHIFERNIGANWERLIEDDKQARHIFETVSSLQLSEGDEHSDTIEILENQFARIHFRSMSIMTGSAVASYLWDQDLETRRELMESIFGGAGPDKIDNVLQKAGLDQESILAKVADSTAKQSIAYVFDQNTAPEINSEKSFEDHERGIPSQLIVET